jgi:hypothetical protein
MDSRNSIASSLDFGNSSTFFGTGMPLGVSGPLTVVFILESKE